MFKKKKKKVINAQTAGSFGWFLFFKSIVHSLQSVNPIRVHSQENTHLDLL